MKPLRLQHVERILVLNRNHIGDCLLTTPMLRALKRRFPGAHVAVSVPESNRELLETNPHVDEIVIRPEIRSWGAKFRFFHQMRGQGYDLIVSLQEKSTFYAWCAFLLSLQRPRRPVTVALDHPRTRRWYQHVSPVVADQHEVYKYLGVARLLGCPRERSPVLELEPTPLARKRVASSLEQFGASADTRFIGINPGGTKPEKRWSVDGFAQVARRLQDELRLPIVVLGGSCDLERAQRIAGQLPAPPLITAGWATLGDTAAVLERCAIVVTNDTGPMHMAVALAVPVVALFGPTSPTKFGPFSRQARVLHHQEPCTRCQRPCLHTVTVEEVVEAVLGLYRPLASGAAREDGR